MTDSERRMRAVVQRWRASGEPSGTFAQRHGLTRDKFSYWRRRLAPDTIRRRARPAKAEAFSPSPVLLPVRVVEAEPGGREADVEVLLAGGDRIRVGHGVSGELLRLVVGVLRAQC